MTRRERLERKLEKRRDWAEAREKRAAQESDKVHNLLDPIPLGQPVLVGHHSEKRHRRTLQRADDAMRRSVESSNMAKHHKSKADGIEWQLETSIFSDDPDAIEALEAKAAELDRLGNRDVAINKAWRKYAKVQQTGPNSYGLEIGCLPALLAAWEALGISEKLASEFIARVLEYSWLRSKGPCDPAYNRANARRARERIAEIKRRRAEEQKAEEAGGLLITRHATIDWCSVRFAEFPGRSITNALKAAGFRWGGGQWSGATSRLPQVVVEMEGAENG